MSAFRDLFLLLAIMLVAAKAAGALSRRLSQPAVLGELLVGLVLGPTVLDLLALPPFKSSPGLHLVVDALAQIGVVLLMFLAGLEMNTAALRRVGLTATASATGGVFLSLFGGMALGLAFGISVTEAAFLGTILTATSVSISAQTLIEMEALNSKEGTTIVGAAIISDCMGIFILSLAITAAVGLGGASPYGSTMLTLVRVILFLWVGVLLLGRLVRSLLRRVVEQVHNPAIVTAVTIALILFYAWGAERLGNLASITGAFALGVICASASYRSIIEEHLFAFTYGFFAPFFFINIGLQADAKDLLGNQPSFIWWLLAVAVGAKMLGAGAGALLTGFNWREASRVASGMVVRGEVALIVASVGLKAGLVQDHTFSAAVIITLLCAVTAPILLRQTYRL